MAWSIDNRRPKYSACASRKVNTFLSDVELCFPSVARSSLFITLHYFFTISSVFLSKTINNGEINFECQNANTVTHHSCSHGLTHTRSPVAMLGTVRQTLFSRDSSSSQTFCTGHTLRLCETPPSPPASDPVGIENCKQLFSPLLAFTTQKIATHSTNIIFDARVAFFWVVNATRNEKSCLQFLIPTAVFHMLLRRYENKTYSQCVSLVPLRALLKLSLLHSIVFYIALRQCETNSQCVSLAPPRQLLELHSMVFHTIWNTFSVCLSHSAESAIEALSLALHSVSHRLKDVRSLRVNIESLDFSIWFTRTLYATNPAVWVVLTTYPDRYLLVLCRQWDATQRHVVSQESWILRPHSAAFWRHDVPSES